MSEFDDLLARVRSGDTAPAPSDDYKGLLARVRGAPDPSLVESSNIVASFKKPDQAAEQLRLVRDLKDKLGEDWSPEAIDPTEAQRRLRVAENDHVLRNSPKLAEKFLHPEFASIAHDDAPVLGEIEKVASYIGNRARAVAAAIPQVNAGLWGLAAAPFDLVGADGAGDWLRKQQKITQAMGKTWGPQDNPDWMTNAIDQGLTSAGQNLLNLPLAFLPGGQTAALSAMVAPVFGEAYGKNRDVGNTPLQALNAGAADAAFEWAGEKFGLGNLVKNIKVGSGFGKTLLGYMAREVPGEMATTLAQSFNEYANVNPDKPFKEWVAQLPDELAQTFVATMVGGGAVATTVKAADKAISLVSGQDQQAQQATQLAEALTQFNTFAEASRVRQRDTETAQSFFQSLMDEGNDSVWITPDALAQSGMAEQIAQAMPSVADQIQSAITSNHDIELPIAELMAKLPGEQLAQSIIPHVAETPGGFTMTTAQEYMQSDKAKLLQDTVEEVLAGKQLSDEHKQSQEAVKQAVLDNLNQHSKFGPTVNEAYATLMSAYASTRAWQLGVTPEQYFSDHLLKTQSEAIGGMKYYQSIEHEFGAVGIQDAIAKARHEQDRLNQHDLDAEIASVSQNGEVDYSSLVGDSRYWDEEYEEWTEAGFLEVDRLVEEKARDNLRLLDIKELSDLDDAHQWAQYEAMKHLLDAAGIEYNDTSSLSSKYLEVLGHKIRFADHANQVKDSAVRGRLPVFNVAPGEQSFSDAVAAVKRWINDAPTPDSASTRSSAPDTGIQERTVRAVNPGSSEPAQYEIGAGSDGNVTSVSDDVYIPNTYYQNQGTNRGAYNPEANIITLLKDADLSTFLHEAGHYFFETDIAVASSLAQEARVHGYDTLTDGEKQILSDVSALLSWHGIQGDIAEQLRQWDSMDFEERRSHHERTAESFEHYLFEGKAPSIELHSYFQKFGIWLKRVYTSLKDFLTKNPEAGKLNDEVRSVFDRMIATNEQIELAEKARSLMPLFGSAQQAGMTEEEFAAYQQQDAKAALDAVDDLQSRTLRDLKWARNAHSRALKNLQKDASEVRSVVEMEARRQVMSQPVYQAWSFLTGRAGEKTDAQKEHASALADWNKDRSDVEQKTRESLKDKLFADNPDVTGLAKGQLVAKNKRQFDIQVQQALLDWEKTNPKPVAPSAPSEGNTAGGAPFGRISIESIKELGLPLEIVNHLKALKMTAKEGWHPDLIAERFGFRSGEDMIRQITAAQTPKEAIAALADQMMLENHAEISTPEALERAADMAVFNEARARFVATELAAVEKLAGGNRTLAKAAQQYADTMISRLLIKNIKPQNYAAAEARAAKAADKAHKSGDVQQAAIEKRNQMINIYAAKAAYAAQEEAKQFSRSMAQWATRSDDKLKKSYDLDLVNAVRAILGEYGIAERRAKRASEYLEVFKQNDPDMYAVVESSVQYAERNAKPLKEMTVEEMRALKDELGAIMHLAKRVRQSEVDGDLIDREEIVAHLDARLSEIGVPDTPLGNSSAVTDDELRMVKLRTALANMTRAESWVDKMDGSNPMGPFRTYLFNRIKDAADAYRTDKAKYLREYRALLNTIAPSLKPMTIDAPELGYTFGKDTGGSAMNEILHAILHTGNQSNKRKMLLGRKWATEIAEGVLDTSRWDAFISRLVKEGKLTQAHFDFAQGVWDLLESTKPLAQKTHRDVFGKYFDEVTADGFVDPFGVQRRGGYVPAMADSRVVTDAKLRALQETENASMAFAFPTTNKGFTKARVEYNRPLLLDLKSLAQHLDKVILFSHMEMPVRDVQRLVKQIGGKLDRIDPGIIAGMIQPWLTRSAKQQVVTPITADAGFSRFCSVIRSRAGMAAMFGNLANAVQQITGFSMAAVKVKPGLLLSASADYAKNPRNMAKVVSESSPYMRERMANEVASMADDIDKILLNPSLLEKGQQWSMRHAYFLQSAVDNVMGPVIWTAAYNQAIEQKLDHKDAVRLADAAVRQTQGSTLPEDISRMEGGNAFVRLFTQFAGYFNMQANLLGTEFAKVMQEQGLRKGAGRGMYILMLGFLAPAIVGELVMQLFRGGPDDEDKDGEYLDDWLAQLFVWAPIRNATAMIPVAGQSINSAVNAWNSKPYDDRMASSPAISMIESAVKALPDLYQNIVEDKGNWQKTVRDVATLISMSVGLPANIAARPIGYEAGVAQGNTMPTSAADRIRGDITGTASPESKNR